MIPVLILASDYSEAAKLARLAGLKGSIGWDVLTVNTAIGRRGAPLLSTGLHCWRSRRNFTETHDIGRVLLLGGFKVVHVPCPGDWAELGFELPPDWWEPVSVEPKVVLHPPVPKRRSRWRRFLDRVTEPADEHTW